MRPEAPRWPTALHQVRCRCLEAILTIWLAALGLSVGSFLNVVIARVPHGESVVRPRSKCPKCGHQLPWYENIPVLSWVWLRGKCSGCGQPISPRYVFVELLTASLFLAVTTRFPWDWPMVSALVFVSVLVPLVFIDAEHWILPFELTLPGIAAGLIFALPQGHDVFLTALAGALAGFLSFRVMEFAGWWFTGREALGAGDKYLLAMVGAQLGWRPLLGVILFSSLQGAVVGLVRMRVTGRAGPDAAPEPEPPPAAPPPEGVTGAQPGAPTPEAPAEDDAGWREPFSPAFLAKDVPWWKRLVLLPYTLFLQDVPDSPPADAETGEEPQWVPGKSNLPFGPWIGLAALEVLFFGPWMIDVLAHTPFRLTAEILFGG